MFRPCYGGAALTGAKTASTISFIGSGTDAATIRRRQAG
jgi:hypothetical protein